MQYSYIPDAATFRKDSSVTLARRASDPVLTRIDNLLAFYQGHRFDTDTEMQLLALAALTDLFMATRYWIRLAAAAKNHLTLKPERLPAVQALHGALVRQLALEVGIAPEAVADFVRDFKCRTMTDHGKHIDSYIEEEIGKSSPVTDFYFKTARRAATAVRFKNGVAYRLGTRDGQKGRLVKLNSADFESTMVRANQVSLKGWAPFAMGEEGDLYMTRHFISAHEPGNDAQERIYHSNYTGGGPLIAAGTMLVVDGLILGIRGDSGHYKPTDHNIAEALRVLATRGVKVQRIKVFPWNGNASQPPTGAMAFIASQRKDFIRQLGAIKQKALTPPSAPVVQGQPSVPSVASVHLAPVQEQELYSNVS